MNEKTDPKNFITIQGKRFHYMWLRDHCSSCRYPAPYQQLYDPNISDRPEFPQPLKIELNEENLIIDWDETPTHRSIFPISWLLSHAYDPAPQEPKNTVAFWDREQIKSHALPEYEIDAIADNTWIEQLQTFGFVRLTNITFEELTAFLSKIGPLHNTDYGSTFRLKEQISSDRPNKPLRDGCPLPPHNDLSYWGGHRLMQFLYCVENNTSGGDSILVDGFRIARDFHRDYPEYFQLLVDTPVQFWLIDEAHQYQFCNTAPILECDRDGHLTTVRFSKRNCRPYLPFEEIEKFYEAFTLFFKYLKKSDYQYLFRLESEDCLLFQNFRILHGRTAFDISQGMRKLNAGYLAWDFVQGRQNFINLEH